MQHRQNRNLSLATATCGVCFDVGLQHESWKNDFTIDNEIENGLITSSSLVGLIMYLLLYPFWNYWLSLQADWHSVVGFIHESHCFLLLITSVLNRTIFALYRIICFEYKMRCNVKPFLFPLFQQTGYWITISLVLKYNEFCVLKITVIKW